MASGTADRPAISVVGPGRLGSALATNLRRAGLRIQFLVVRPGKRVPRGAATLALQLKATAISMGEERLPAGLVWITVPDDEIGEVAFQLARLQSWRGSTVFHSSGALTSDVLAPLRDKGASVASVHPGMTFVRRSVQTLEGVPFGVEGDPAAVRLAKKIVKDLGGRSFAIRKESKVLYHAFDTLASPMLIALMSALEQVGRAAGINAKDIRSMAGPLLRQTMANYLEHGAAEAFSGPLIRGDVETIRRHLDALQKVRGAREAYVALAKVAISELPVRNRKELEKAIS